MANTSSALRVNSNDLINPKNYPNVVGVVEIKPMVVDFEVVFESGQSELQLKAADKAAKGVLKKYQGLIAKQLDEALARVAKCHDADKTGDTSAFDTAAGILKKANDYISELMDDLRVDTRKGIADTLGLKAKSLQSIGSVKFKELKIVKGAFANEVNYDDKSELAAAMKKKKWQHCAVAWKAKDASIRIDEKREIKADELKDLKKEIGPNVEFGMFKAQGTSNCSFEFLKTGSLQDPKLVGSALRKFFKKELNKAVAVDVQLVASYTDDGGKAESSTEEGDAKKSKTKEKDKPKEKDKKKEEDKKKQKDKK